MKLAEMTVTQFANVLAFMRDNKIQAFTTAGNCSEVYGLWAKHKKRNGKLEIEKEALKKEKDICILAHSYQTRDIVEIADDLKKDHSF